MLVQNQVWPAAGTNGAKRTPRTVFDFAGAMANQKKAENNALARAFAAVQDQTASAAAAEQAGEETGRKIPGQESGWSDELLAFLIGFRTAARIDTSNKINWDSTGDHRLTDSERTMLRARYDVDNLTPQSYYDLMADLSRMNVLSGADIMAMHLKQFDGGPDGVLLLPEQVTAGYKNCPFVWDDIFDTLDNEMDYLKRQSEFAQSDAFLKINPAFSQAGAREKHIAFIGEQYATYHKIYSVLNEIRR